MRLWPCPGERRPAAGDRARKPAWNLKRQGADPCCSSFFSASECAARLLYCRAAASLGRPPREAQRFVLRRVGSGPRHHALRRRVPTGNSGPRLGLASYPATAALKCEGDVRSCARLRLRDTCTSSSIYYLPDTSPALPCSIRLHCSLPDCPPFIRPALALYIVVRAQYSIIPVALLVIIKSYIPSSLTCPDAFILLALSYDQHTDMMCPRHRLRIPSCFASRIQYHPIYSPTRYLVRDLAPMYPYVRFPRYLRLPSACSGSVISVLMVLGKPFLPIQKLTEASKCFCAPERGCFSSRGGRLHAPIITSASVGMGACDICAS